MKLRLDKLLCERGLAPSRERAQALILAGRVLVNEQKIDKSGATVAEDAAIRLLGDEMRYVSRGGLKLEHALKYWNVSLQDHNCLDIGASTGGFSDCMLQHGAAQVIAVDTGYGQMDARLRNDRRVHLLEKTNARYLSAADLKRDHPQTILISFLAMDVSFISATLVLPAVVSAVRQNNQEFHAPEAALETVILVKPQFEVGRELVGKGGIVRDLGARQGAVERIRAAAALLGGHSIEVIDSPLLGAEGNKEFLLYCRFEER